MIGLIVMWTISFFFANLLTCVPVTLSIYHPVGSKCVNVTMVTWVLGTSGVITDFIIMVIPWPLVWRLQMPTRQKFAVIGMFLLGALYVCQKFDLVLSRLIHDVSLRTIAASLVRCIIFFTIGSVVNPGDYTRKIPKAKTACEILRGSADLNGENIFWAEAECGLAIISSCLPTLGRLLHGWTVALNLRASMLSFRFSNAAVTHDAARSKPSDSSYINLGESSSNSIAGHVQKSSTSATYSRDVELTYRFRRSDRETCRIICARKEWRYGLGVRSELLSRSCRSGHL